MPEHDTPTPTPDPSANAGRTRLARLALVVYWPLLAAATHWPSLVLVETQPPRTSPYSMLQSDKPIHLVSFALLAALLVLARPIGRHRSPNANRLAAAAIALGYAVVDEVTQSFASERTVSMADFLANAIGIVGVLLLALTPASADPRPAASAVRSARRRMATAVAGIFLGGLLLSASGTVNRETYAVHFVAGAAFALALLRAAPVWPSRPRVSVALACVAVGGTVVAAETAQAFGGLPFSHDEAYYAHIGLLLAMSLWVARLVIAGPGVPVGDDEARDGSASAEDAAEPTQAVPAHPPRA